MPRTIISAIHGPATIVDKRTERKECRALIDQLLRAIKQAMTETHRGNLNNVAHLIKKIFRYEYFTVHPKRLFFLRKSTIMEQMLELCFKLNEEDTLLEWRDSLTETMECFYKEVKAENHADNKELLESWEWLRQIVEEHPDRGGRANKNTARRKGIQQHRHQGEDTKQERFVVPKPKHFCEVSRQEDHHDYI